MNDNENQFSIDDAMDGIAALTNALLALALQLALEAKKAGVPDKEIDRALRDFSDSYRSSQIPNRTANIIVDSLTSACRLPGDY